MVKLDFWTSERIEAKCNGTCESSNPKNSISTSHLIFQTNSVSPLLMGQISVTEQNQKRITVSGISDPDFEASLNTFQTKLISPFLKGQILISGPKIGENRKLNTIIEISNLRTISSYYSIFQTTSKSQILISELISEPDGKSIKIFRSCHPEGINLDTLLEFESHISFVPLKGNVKFGVQIETRWKIWWNFRNQRPTKPSFRYFFIWKSNRYILVFMGRGKAFPPGRKLDVANWRCLFVPCWSDFANKKTIGGGELMCELPCIWNGNNTVRIFFSLSSSPLPSWSLANYLDTVFGLPGLIAFAVRAPCVSKTVTPRIAVGAVDDTPSPLSLTRKNLGIIRFPYYPHLHVCFWHRVMICILCVQLSDVFRLAPSRAKLAT